LPQTLTRIATTALLALAAAWANAQAGDWGDVTIVSGTVGNNPNRLCMGVPDYMRPADIGCPSYAPSLSTAGHVSITGNVSANKFVGDGSGLTNLNVHGDRIVSDTHAAIVNQNTGYVSLTTGGGTWGYLSAGWSYLATLFTNTVSSSLVSATNVSATYIDATRSGTVSGTYGYFGYISGTQVYGTFVGDGSGLSGIGYGDRVVSGTSRVLVSQDRSVTIRTAGSERVTVGENGFVGIGTDAPTHRLSVGGNQLFLADTDRIIWAGGSTIQPDDGTGLFQIYTGAHDIALRTYDGFGIQTRMFVNKGNGHVGIGTMTPSATFHVSGSVRVAGTGAETCDANMLGGLRRNPSSGLMELCQ
jgi:hypothetical protein